MKRVLSIVMVVLLAGCARPGPKRFAPNEAAMRDAVKLTIVPDPVQPTRYSLECESCDTPAAVRVDRGDWVGWTHEFETDPLVLEFAKAGDDETKRSRAARLWGLGNPNVLVTATVHRGDWTWMKVGPHAEEGEHLYGVQGLSYGDPPPGIIVCPPGSTDPKCN